MVRAVVVTLVVSWVWLVGSPGVADSEAQLVSHQSFEWPIRRSSDPIRDPDVAVAPRLRGLQRADGGVEAGPGPADSPVAADVEDIEAWDASSVAVDEGVSLTQPRLKIVTGGDMESVSDAGEAIDNQRAYAHRHGYDFDVVVGNLVEPWAPYWHKIGVLLQELELPPADAGEIADVVVWMDLDVVVTNPSQRMLERVLSEHPAQHVILAQDPRRGETLPGARRAKRIANTGIILVRRSLGAIRVLRKLFDYGRQFPKAAYAAQASNTLHEQDAFNWLLGGEHRGWWRKQIVVIPQRGQTCNLNTFARNIYDGSYGDPLRSEWTLGDFAVHCSGLRPQLREWCIDDSVAAALAILERSGAALPEDALAQVADSTSGVGG